MFTRTISALAAIAFTAGTLALSTPLRAATAEEQVSVRIGDLDLSTARGVATLERRVRAAAREICGWAPVLDLNMRSQIAECQESAIASGRQQIEIALASARSKQRIALYSR